MIVPVRFPNAPSFLFVASEHSLAPFLLPLAAPTFCSPPRISRLPESFGTPVSWSAADLSELQYPHLESQVREQKEEWAEFYSSLKASSPGCGVAQDELSWAIGVAYSRAFR